MFVNISMSTWAFEKKNNSSELFDKYNGKKNKK